MAIYDTADIGLVEALREILDNHTRIRIRYEWGAEVEGYLLEDPISHEVVISYNCRSRRASPVRCGSIRTVSTANRRLGGKLWPIEIQEEIHEPS